MNVGKKTIEYRKDDVWLADYGGLKPITILEAKEGFIQHKYQWETVEDWHKRTKFKMGTVRRFCGFKFGIKKHNNRICGACKVRHV